MLAKSLRSLYIFSSGKRVSIVRLQLKFVYFFYYFHIVIAFYFEFNEILCARVNSAIKFIYAALRVKWKHILLASREFGRAVPDLQIEFTPALAKHFQIPNQTQVQPGDQWRKKNETKHKKLKSKSKCKPDYHKNGRRAASLTRGHILNVNRRRYHCPYILLPRPPPAQPRMQRWCCCCCCLLQRCVVRAHQKFNKIPLNYKMKTIHFSWPQFLKFSYRSSTGAGLYLYLCFSGFIIIMQQQQKKLQRFVSLKQQHLMSLCSYKQ